MAVAMLLIGLVLLIAAGVLCFVRMKAASAGVKQKKGILSGKANLGVALAGGGCILVGAASLAVEMVLLTGPMMTILYSEEEVAKECHCIAECVYGAKTVDFTGSRYDESALWANGFYLTHDPYNAAAFLNYALYMESMGAFKAPATGTAKAYTFTEPVSWAEGTNYACTINDYTDGHPVIFIHCGFGDYGQNNTYVVTDGDGGKHQVYLNTEFYRFKHEEYLKETYPEESFIITTDGEHSYIQSLFDTEPLFYYDTCDVTIENWDDWPEISSTVAKSFCVTYEYVKQHKTEDGTQTDYSGMINNLAGYARWFYDEGATDGVEAELSQSKYYAFAGKTVDNAEGGYVFTPAYHGDAVYVEYYEEWVSKYGNSAESLADLLYYIMRDNKYLGVNIDCNACGSSYVQCEGADWYVSYLGIYAFVMNERIGLEYEDLGESNAEVETPVGPVLPSTPWGGVAGNNIGNATGEYSCNIPEIMGARSYYGFSMTGGGAGSKHDPHGNNLVPHGVIDGIEISSVGACTILGSDGKKRNTMNMAGCPVYSMAASLSNVLGTPITPFELCYATNHYKIENGKFVFVGTGTWWKRSASIGTNSSNARGDIFSYDGKTLYANDLMEFGKSYDPTFTMWATGSAEEAFNALCDPTKNTVLRYSKATTSIASWDKKAFMGDGNVVYKWDGGTTRHAKGNTATEIGGGHFFYVVDADPVSKQVLLCYNLTDTGYRWLPYNLMGAHSGAGYLVLQTDKRDGAGGGNASMGGSLGMEVPDISGYANPTTTEEGRVDFSPMKSAGIQFGSRRFDGSWYTKIEGWTTAAEPARVEDYTWKHGDKTQVTHTALYDQPPYNFSDFKQVYFLDARYAGADMSRWLNATIDYWGADASHASISVDDFSQDDLQNSIARKSFTYLTTHYSNYAGWTWQHATNPGYDPFCIAGMPAFTLNGNGPISDSYWEKYTELSGMYKPGGLFKGCPNPVNQAYETNIITVIKEKTTGKLFYVPTVMHDGSGHFFPLALGQTCRQPANNDISDINDPNATIAWEAVTSDNGPNLHFPRAANVNKETGELLYDISMFYTANYAGKWSSLSLAEKKALLDPVCAYGLPVTVSGKIGYSTMYDYIHWIVGNKCSAEMPRNYKISEYSRRLALTTLKVESTGHTRRMLNGTGGYELYGIILCK